MKRLFPLSILLLFSFEARADDQIRSAESNLKNQGFYYGEVDGRATPELSAAIRRYQIRNGLEVTGELNKETLSSLGLGVGGPTRNAGSSSPAANAPEASDRMGPPPSTPAPTKNRPPVNLRRNGDDESAPPEPPVRRAPEEFSRVPIRREPGYVPAPAPLDEGGAVAANDEYSRIFSGSPYATAPRPVQEGALRRAQRVLADRGLYHDDVDGRPGPATEEAILSYQRGLRIPPSGRLDLQTLAALRLLPGSSPVGPPLKPFNGPAAGPRPVYRGVWVE